MIWLLPITHIDLSSHLNQPNLRSHRTHYTTLPPMKLQRPHPHGPPLHPVTNLDFLSPTLTLTPTPSSGSPFPQQNFTPNFNALLLSLSLSPFINSTQIHSHSEFHFTVISNPTHTLSLSLSLSLPWRSSFYSLSLHLRVFARSRRPSLPLSSLSVSSSQIDECVCIIEFPYSHLGFSMALLGVFHTHHFQICKFHFFLIFFFFFLHFGFLNLCKYICFCRLVAEKVREKRREEKKSEIVLNFDFFFGCCCCLSFVCFFWFSFGYICFLKNLCKLTFLLFGCWESMGKRKENKRKLKKFWIFRFLLFD